VLGALIDLVGSLLGASWGHDATVRSMQKARDRAYASGRDVFFPGVVTGSVAYATRVDGWLVLSAGDLWWSAAEGYRRSLWRPLPIASLRAVRERTARGDVVLGLRRAWVVMECMDGLTPVEIACDAYDVKFVRAALGTQA